MSLLSHNKLCQLVNIGVIENSGLDLVNAASIDIRLGSKILVEDNPHRDRNEYHKPTVSLARKEALRMHSVDISKEPYILAPGEFILAQSFEIFHLPNNIAGEYKLKSSMARIGLEHLNAGWCDPGWHGSVLTLEFSNLTSYHFIELRYLDKIGQVVFFECEPVPEEASYATKGGYNNNKEVTTPDGHSKIQPGD